MGASRGALLSADAEKAYTVEVLLRARPVISVQGLNEVSHVCRRKAGMDWQEIHEFLSMVRSFCKTVPLTEEIHDRGRVIAERHRLSFYDSCIIAAAVAAGCRCLYSEDMSDGQILEGGLALKNPFATA